MIPCSTRNLCAPEHDITNLKSRIFSQVSFRDGPKFTSAIGSSRKSYPAAMRPLTLRVFTLICSSRSQFWMQYLTSSFWSSVSCFFGASLISCCKNSLPRKRLLACAKTYHQDRVPIAVINSRPLFADQDDLFRDAGTIVCTQHSPAQPLPSKRRMACAPLSLELQGFH